MSNEQKQTSVSEVEQMTPNEILAAGWRLTRAIFALKGMEIPDTIHFQSDGGNHIRATRVATLEELAKATAALDNAVEQLNQGASGVPSYLRYDNIEQLHAAKKALLELQNRARERGSLGSTTVIEALFPDVPVKKKTAAERAELEQWLAIRKEEALRIDPETAEVHWSYAQTLDPYGALDEWELPEEFHQIGREYFARNVGSDIWVEFGDLPDETRDKLRNRYSRRLAFPAGLEGFSDISDNAGHEDDIPF
jgi:hypothetical protein